VVGEVERGDQDSGIPCTVGGTRSRGIRASSSRSFLSRLCPTFDLDDADRYVDYALSLIHMTM
jgi:hypothetical protein